MGAPRRDAVAGSMSPKFVLNAVVSYKDVDREETLLLSSIFGFLQEAAIQQANLFDTGTRAAAASGSSWVLNRMSVKIDRYPKYEDHLRVETWSARVAGFRGYREYRIFSGEERIISGSSLWLYFNLSSKALVRVPAQVAENFPSVEDEVYAPNLDTFRSRFRLRPPRNNLYRFAIPTWMEMVTLTTPPISIFCRQP